jgi:hypothetical protein
MPLEAGAGRWSWDIRGMKLGALVLVVHPMPGRLWDASRSR